jgi:thiol peroxidase
MNVIRTCGWVVLAVATGVVAACGPTDNATTERQRTMQERTGLVTFKGDPLTLLGPELKVGDDAPDITLINTDLEEVPLGSYKGKIVVLSVVPSLDTGVCSTQTKRFNDEAEQLDDDVEIVTVSMDLPFAQARWCGAEGAERVTTLSDYKTHEFGKAYGVRIKELGLLARSVWVVDADGEIQYIQIVKETTDEPDYSEALAAVKALSE